MSVDPDDLTPGASRGSERRSFRTECRLSREHDPGSMPEMRLAWDPRAAISLTTMFDVLLPQIFAETNSQKSSLSPLATGLCQLCKSCHFPTAHLEGTDMLDGFDVR